MGSNSETKEKSKIQFRLYLLLYDDTYSWITSSLLPIIYLELQGHLKCFKTIDFYSPSLTILM